MLGQVIELSRHLTAAAEGLTKPTGQSLARWLVLAEARGVATVADIARRLRLTRQSVQRVADLLVSEGLCVYEENPRHRRAKLLVLTEEGSTVLDAIETAQREWCDEQGARIGESALRDVYAALGPVLEEFE